LCDLGAKPAQFLVFIRKLNSSSLRALWALFRAGRGPFQMDGENDTGDYADLFKDPEDFYQPDKPATYAAYILLDGREIRLRLVGHNPLWVCLVMPHPGARQ